MGTIELNQSDNKLFIYSNILFYGNQATQELVDQCVEEINTMWNEPNAKVIYKGDEYFVEFVVKGYLFLHITPQDIFENRNPKNNYIRIEEYAAGNISFVDGLKSNTGYFKLENLYKGSTTAAHEYGHTLGLDHPTDLDLRGKGVPGIMYPRGTLVDPQYQYDPNVPAGEKGGTMHPMHRKVTQNDIDNLKLHELNLVNPNCILGSYSAIYHQPHTSNQA
ncbi:MAG: peptidase M10 [Chitinophagaceae bacterium]|nr:peptidase M10 [Chitinophagaceae bacterium]